jgi:hypothetical protein
MGVGGWFDAAQASAPQWQRQLTPVEFAAGLTGISCPTVKACAVVGTMSSSTGSGALAESWNGKAWKLDTVRQPVGDTNADLLSASCSSSTSCVAVGYTGIVPPQGSHPFSEELSGTTWKAVPTALPSAAEGGELASVSCAGARSCQAVGSFVTAAGRSGILAEAYNGSSWTVVKTPSIPGRISSLDGISCLPATVPALCTAVGSTTIGDRTSPLVEHANGSSWAVVPVPGVFSSSEATLASVSCPQPTSCVAVGSTLDGSISKSLSEVENLSRWTVVGTPRPTTPGGSRLLGVSCALTIESCEAVGAVGTAASSTLAEGWNGHSWSIQTSADPSSLSELFAVSCAETSLEQAACFATGGYQPNPDVAARTLVERY